MSKTLPWFRIYSEMLNDRKIKRICKRTGQSKALIVGVWTCLLALANDSSERGKLLIASNTPYSLEELADEIELPVELLGQIFDEFIVHGMIDGCEICNWEARQFKSDNVTERVKKFRMKRSSNVIDQNRTESEQITPQNVAEVYEVTFGNLAGLTQVEIMDSLVEKYTFSWFKDAMKETAANNGRSLQYTTKVLENWKIFGRNGSDGKYIPPLEGTYVGK